MQAEYDKAENAKEDLETSMKELNGNLKKVIDELAQHKMDLQESKEENERLKKMLEQLSKEKKVTFKYFE